jgi:hypothetical protein
MALALYIANLCETTATALERRGATRVSDEMTKGVNEFTT